MERPSCACSTTCWYATLNTSPGQEVKLSILRDGKIQEISVRLVTRFHQPCSYTLSKTSR